MFKWLPGSPPPYLFNSVEPLSPPPPPSPALIVGGGEITGEIKPNGKERDLAGNP